MKKGALLMLLVLLLSFSVLVAAESLNGYSNSQENILNMAIVENQTVTASVSGVESVLSDQFSEQADSAGCSSSMIIPVTLIRILSFPISLERQISKGWSIYLAVES